jgi:hypothetical protein
MTLFVCGSVPHANEDSRIQDIVNALNTITQYAQENKGQIANAIHEAGGQCIEALLAAGIQLGEGGLGGSKVKVKALEFKQQNTTFSFQGATFNGPVSFH